MDEMRDILNDFMEPDGRGNVGNGGDGVDKGATRSNQYFDNFFI